MTDDFQLTACISLLKLVIVQHNSGYTCSDHYDDPDDLETNGEDFSETGKQVDVSQEATNSRVNAVHCNEAVEASVSQIVALDSQKNSVQIPVELNSRNGSIIVDAEDNEERLAQSLADVSEDQDTDCNFVVSYEQKEKGKCCSRFCLLCSFSYIENEHKYHAFVNTRSDHLILFIFQSKCIFRF